jgi:hypothetical protein
MVAPSRCGTGPSVDGPASRATSRPASGQVGKISAPRTSERLQLDHSPGGVVHLHDCQAESVPQQPEPFTAGPGDRLLQLPPVNDACRTWCRRILEHCGLLCDSAGLSGRQPDIGKADELSRWVAAGFTVAGGPRRSRPGGARAAAGLTGPLDDCSWRRHAAASPAARELAAADDARSRSGAVNMRKRGLRIGAGEADGEVGIDRQNGRTPC